MFWLLVNLQIDPKLGSLLNKLSPDEPVELFIVLKDQLLLPENLRVSPSEKVAILKNYHFNSQRPLVELLKASSDVYEIKQFWVVNAIYVKVKRGAFERLFLNRDDIDIIYYDKDNFHITAFKGNDNTINAVAWGVSKIKADSVWILYGYTGNGVIVGHIDTGVDANHPALSGDVLSQYWKDPINNQSNPYDDNGHGTHTAGTIAGGDGLGPFTNDIGVAPNAKIISCKAFDANGSGSSSAITTCVQHFTDLKANQGVNVALVSNSWGGGGGNTWLWNSIWNGWRANNIIPVFAAGNSGPGSGTVGSPGDYPIVIAVGATNSSDQVASFSSRGPAPSTSPYNNTSYWSRPDWNYYKPDIAAPGVSIYSSVPGGGYQSWDGTSMATPHVAGVIALMLEKNPTLTYTQIYMTITDYGRVRPTGCGSTWPNNNCGWGRIDAKLAIENTPSNTTPNIVVQSHTIQDANNNGYLDPGESANLDITIKNNGGADAFNVTATLSTTSSIITITDNTINFGTLASNNTKSGSAINDLFSFQISSSAQIGDTATLKITINYTDNNNNPYQTTYNIPITIGSTPLSIVDIDTGTVLLSLPDNGSLGYPDYSQTVGNGFRFPKNAASALYYSSFAFGNASSYLVDNFYNSTGADSDIKREFGIYSSVLFGGPFYGHEEYVLTISDGNFASPKGVKAYLTAYGKINSPFVFLRYKLKNEGNTNLSNVYMAVFADFDLNNYTNDNANTLVCNTGQFKGAAYMSSSDFTGYVGVMLVSGNWGYARVANQSSSWPYTGDGFKWGMITGTSGATSGTNADFSVSVSSGPYTLNVGDSAIAVFAFFGSSTQPDCNITNWAEKEYADLTFKFIVKDNKLKLIMPVEDRLNIKIYSTSGRIVFSNVYQLKQGNYEIPLNIPKGVYIITIKGDKISKTSKFVN